MTGRFVVADLDNDRVHKFEDKGLSGQLPTDPTHTNWGHAKQDWLDLSVGTAAATRSTEKYRDSARQKFSGEIDDVEVMVQTRVNIAFRPDAVDSFSATIAYAEPVNTEYTATFTETGDGTNEFTAEIEVVEGTGGGTQLCLEPEEIHAASGPGTFTPIVLRVHVPDELEAEHDFATTYAGHRTSNRFKCRAFPNSEGIWWNVGEYGFSPPLWLGERLDAEDKRKQMVWLGLEDGVELKPGIQVKGIRVLSTVVEDGKVVEAVLWDKAEDERDGTADPENPDPKCVGTYGMRAVEVELSVDGNTSTDDPEDGVTNYLPGYLGNTCVLYSSGVYSPQGMKIVVDVGTNEKVDSMTFEMERVTQHPGFCSNAGEGTVGKDYSFSVSGDPDEAPGVVESGKSWVDIWCKDFGGTCRVRVTAEVGGNTYPVGVIEIPVDVDGDGMADKWEKKIRDSEGYSEGRGQFGWFADCDKAVGYVDEQTGPRHYGFGDLLPAIDEYRGFICGNPLNPDDESDTFHKRTNPERKDVFYTLVDVKSGETVPLVPPRATTLRNLGYEIHFVPEIGRDDPRFVSPYDTPKPGYWATHRQKYIVFEYHKYLRHFPKAYGATYNESGYIADGDGTPVRAGIAQIGMRRIRKDFKPYSETRTQNIVVHEMGHQLSLQHYKAIQQGKHGPQCVMKAYLGYPCLGSEAVEFCTGYCWYNTSVILPEE